PARSDDATPILPSRTAFLLAFLSVVAGGVFGGIIGYGLADVSCDRDCGGGQAVGAVVGALLGAVGVAVVAVLVLRALAEWRLRSRGHRLSATDGRCGPGRRVCAAEHRVTARSRSAGTANAAAEAAHCSKSGPDRSAARTD